MKLRALKSLRNESGAAVIEFAIAVPVLVLMMWGIFQIGMVFQANAGMQNALGEAARYATIFPTPTDTQIQAKITGHKFGLRGTWSPPTITPDATTKSMLITVQYSQPLDFLMFPGPTVTLTKSKRVYLST